MKKIIYLLSVGLVVSLSGCGSMSNPVVTPVLTPPTEVTAPVIAHEPVNVAPVVVPTPNTATIPATKKVTASVPKPAPVVATKWVTTNTYSGNGVQTKNLAITENTRITWEVTSVAPKVNDIPVDSFNYYLRDNKGYPSAVDVLFAHRNGVGKGTTYLKAVPGKYSLYVNSANCEWTITVEQQK